MRRHYPWLILLFLLLLAALFLLHGSAWGNSYLLSRRMWRLGAMLLAALCVALSSILFQTLSGNRVLSPAVMGYESAYGLGQALLVLAGGALGVVQPGMAGGFVLSLGWVLAYAWLLQSWLGRASLSLAQYLLLGLVLGMVMDTFSQFARFGASPGEFAVLQGLAYISFNRVTPQALYYAVVPVVLAALWLYRRRAELDVLLLGREQAMALGVDYPRCQRRYLALAAVLAAICTSLVGPTAFMGVLVANLAYAVAGSSRHALTLPLGSALAMLLFLLAQWLVEHVFNYRTTVGILVNLLCGVYLLALLLRRKGLA